MMRTFRGLGPSATVWLSLTSATLANTEAELESVAPWGPGITIILVMAAALFCFFIYTKEKTDSANAQKLIPAILRFSLLCLTLWMMYGFLRRPFRTDLPDLLVVVDDSRSMSTVDAITDDAEASERKQLMDKLQLTTTSRLHQAQAILLRDDAKLLRELAGNYNVRIATLQSAGLEASQDVESMQAAVRAMEANQISSSLGATLRRLLQQRRGRPIAAVLYFTDGITTDGPPLSRVALEAKTRDAPLHIVALGSDRPPKDVGLRDLLVDDVVFVGDWITFDFTLTAPGYDGETVNVTLHADNGDEIASEEVVISDVDGDQFVRLTYQAPEEGEFEFTLEVPSLKGEATVENNTLIANIEVRNETTNVLLVHGYPNYEYRYLKTLLERRHGRSADALVPISLDVFLQESDPNYADIDESMLRRFPTRAELFDYDVCIFADVNPTLLGATALENLRDFVKERGRGLAVIAGPRHLPSHYADTPLEELLPFDPRTTTAPPADLPLVTGYQPRLTALGRRLPAMQLSTDVSTNHQHWEELPELYWLLEVNNLSPGVRVLLEHPLKTNNSGQHLPITMVMFVGAGKVWFHGTDESWRWRIAAGDKWFARYWIQVIRYLSRHKLGQGRQVELTSDRESYRRGDAVTLQASFFDGPVRSTDAVTVILEQRNRGQRSILLRRHAADRGIFTATLSDLTVGRFHGWIAEPSTVPQASTDFNVEPPDSEATLIEMDIDDLRTAAQASGGRLYTYNDANKLFKSLPPGKRVRIESLTPISVWNTWKTASLFLALLITEWVLRRRMGLL